VLSGFGEQSSCHTDEPCDISQGLVCAGLSFGDEGICFPAWMRGNFAEADLELDVPDGDDEGITRTVMVYGLASVDMDVQLDLAVSHPDQSELRVTLTNPAGTEVTVFDGETGPGSLVFDGPVFGFSGDEGINGPWTLRVVDTTPGGSGTLHHWTLRLGSRFD
jgi:subtilisin-like proprotein convertase family protein